MKSSETGARLLLCVSESGILSTSVNHVMRRLELATARGEYSDHAVAGCGGRVIRPFAVFFAPSNEINCAACAEMLEKR